MIPIHEFSTGIKAERTPNGGWVSLGFTGKYMNCTLDPIPHPIERSIANQEFALMIAAFSKEPAIIGRVVGTGEDSWGVIAVVTGAKDKNGRTLSLSLYRYFLTPGANNLRYLLAWWEAQGKPTFNPFDSRDIGECAYFDPASTYPPDYDPTANNLELVPTKPTLLQPQQYNLTTVHTLAIKKYNLDKTQPISWAFNVKSLKKPHSFQIIQPAFLRAYENLEREISKLPQSPTDAIPDQILNEIDQIVNQTLKTEVSKPPPSPTDPTPEQVSPKKTLDKASTQKAVKAAIQSLINISQVKPPAVETIIDTLENQQLNTQEWYRLFDAEGATTAITEKIYSSPLARLMTLRAIVIPETLPEFLVWLNIQPGKQPSEAEKTSLQFQSAIRGYFPKEKLGAGINLLIPELFKGEISPESVQWLFIKDRLWDVCRSQFLNDVHYDLEVIYQKSKIDGKNFNNLKFPLEIWQELISSLHSRPDYYYKVPTYKPLAKLFELLKEYDLSAYFYQVSNGEVPKYVFWAASPNPSNEPYSLKYLGLTLQRQITLSEKIMKFTVLNLTIAAGVGFLGLVFFAGYSVGGGFSPWRENIKILESETGNIAETKKEINKIVDELTKQQYPQEEVIKKLATVLAFDELNYNLINPEKDTSTHNLESVIHDIKLSQAISTYHKKQNTTTNPQKFNLWSNQTDTTYKKLEQEVSAALKEDVIKNAINTSNFKKTTDSLKSIIREIKPPSPSFLNVEQLLITRLGLNGKIENLQNFTEQQKKVLVEAIYEYQERNKGLIPDGIIDKNGETYNRLKQDAQ